MVWKRNNVNIEESFKTLFREASHHPKSCEVIREHVKSCKVTSMPCIVMTCVVHVVSCRDVMSMLCQCDVHVLSMYCQGVIEWHVISVYYQCTAKSSYSGMSCQCTAKLSYNANVMSM